MIARPGIARLRIAAIFGSALLSVLLACSSARAVTVAPGFVVEDAFPTATFNIPVQVVFLPGDRRLVVEQGGVVWMMSPEGDQQATPFIDLSPKVLGVEGLGLLGVAIDPDFVTNHWVYFAYTVDPDSDGVDNNWEAYGRVERYQVSAADSNVIDVGTRQVLIGQDWAHGIPCPDTYHTVGSLRFGRDGTLLVPVGEGARFSSTDAGGQDPESFLPGRANPAEDIGSFRALSLNSLAGKILRLDKDTGHGLPSNPFWDGDSMSVRSRVWVYGVRNPYRIALKPGTGSTDPALGDPGVIYIGTTGWNTYEWVGLARHGGMNMGWPCMEGPEAQPLYQAVTQTATPDPNVLCSAPLNYENPVAPSPPLLWWHHTDATRSYPNDWTGHATVGGIFHAGNSYPPPYAGAYFVADFANGWIHWAQMSANDSLTAHGDFLAAGEAPVDVELDPSSGDLYYVSLVANKVRHIRYLYSNLAKSLAMRADSASGAAAYPSPGASSPWKDLAQAHDGTLINFGGDASSGWQGAGSAASPYRLRFDGVDDRVTIPAGSFPELSAPSAVTASLWFRTSSDVNNIQYLFEWLEQYGGSYPGMTIGLGNGKLRVFLSPWADVASLLPNSWYHVAVVKDASGSRVYLDGKRIYTSPVSNLGGQASEIVLGASTYRGAGSYGEFFNGSIAQATVWPTALTDAEVLGDFQAGQLLFQAGPRFTQWRADSASGTGPPPVPSAASPWHDVIGANDATLSSFAVSDSSGWHGDGTFLSPYRLEMDGVNDRVTVPAAGIGELQAPSAVSVSMWIRTGSDVTRSQYLFEWLSQYESPFAGMTMAIANGKFRVFLSPWSDVATVEPNTWYFLTLVKNANQVRAYVNETRRLTSSSPNLGAQNSEIVLGASTYNGPGQYGDFFRGAIAQVILWQRALVDPEVQEAFHESESLYVSAPLSSVVMEVRADSANGSAHYAIPGSGSPWVDLVKNHDLQLGHFNSTSSSGWVGTGSYLSPYRLQFDGLDSRVTLPGGSIPELQSPSAATVSLWFQTGSDVNTTQSLVEWVSQYTSPRPGMSLSISNGMLRVWLNPWVDVAPVGSGVWHHVVVTRRGSEVHVYLNGAQVWTGTGPAVGKQQSQLVLGASTTANNQFTDYFTGAISQFAVWPTALGPLGAQLLYSGSAARYFPVAEVSPPLGIASAKLTARPNPFHATLGLEFELPRAGEYELSLYAVDGRRVRDLGHGSLAAGTHRLTWNGRDDRGRRAEPGLYFARLATADGIRTQRVVFLK